MKKIFLMSSLFLPMFMCGCEIMNEDECRVANWESIGYQSGVNGQSYSVLSEYQSACSKYVFVDTAAFDRGRRTGADVYCTNDNGFSFGANGSAVSDVCRMSSNQANFSMYYKRGKTKYLANKQLSDVDNLIRTNQDYSNDQDLNYFRTQLDSNTRYLYRLRDDLVQYANYVNSYAYENDLERRDYSNQINNVPYPNALDEAKKLKNEIKNAEDVQRKINDEIRNQERKADNSDEPNKYYRKIDCLNNASRYIDSMIDRAIYRGNYRELNNYRDDYRSCLIK